MKYIIQPNTTCKITFIAGLIIALAGCAQTPPLQSGSNWHEDDLVTQNLAAQLSNPADLTSGHGDTTVPAPAFVAAATSWYTSHSPNSGALSIAALGSGSGAP